MVCKIHSYYGDEFCPQCQQQNEMLKSVAQTFNRDYQRGKKDGLKLALEILEASADKMREANNKHRMGTMEWSATLNHLTILSIYIDKIKAEIKD